MTNHSPAKPPTFELLTPCTTTRDLRGLQSIGLRTWPPGAIYTPRPAAELVRLMIIQEGILTCEHHAGSSRVLPREVLCVDGRHPVKIKNLSRADSLSAIEITLNKHHATDDVEFHHRYFADDLKDNKLCRVASPAGGGSTLCTKSSLNLYLSELKNYDTVVLERHANQALAALVIRGTASVDGTTLSAGDTLYVSDRSPMSISSSTAAEVLTIRQLEPSASQGTGLRPNFTEH
ncbi:MAG: hypothetical protein HKN70_06960 [Gammaproteobacteria bacterium]|nr:hypothetical protein [Gammaproteobacteria bacterium]